MISSNRLFGVSRTAFGPSGYFRLHATPWIPIVMSIAIIIVDAADRHPSPQGGFTMIELVVIMMMIGILAIAAVPRMTLMTGYKDMGHRDQLQATIDYARKTAVARRRHTCLTIAGNTATLTGDLTTPDVHVAGTCSASPLLLPSGTNTLNPPSGVTVTNAMIQFDNEGRPEAGVTLTVTDTSSGTTSSLTVETDTGYVHSN